MLLLRFLLVLAFCVKGYSQDTEDPILKVWQGRAASISKDAPLAEALKSMKLEGQKFTEIPLAVKGKGAALRAYQCDWGTLVLVYNQSLQGNPVTQLNVERIPIQILDRTVIYEKDPNAGNLRNSGLEPANIDAILKQDRSLIK